MSEQTKQIKIGEGAFSLPFVLSFPTEKEWLDENKDLFPHMVEANRKELLKSVYREAKRIQRIEEKKK